MVAHIRAKTQKMKQQQEELEKIRHERPDFSEDIVSEMSPIDLMKFYERSWKDLFDFWNVFRYDHRIDLCLEINDQT